MNLEDLILDTQISELKRLQSGCFKAREVLQKVRSLTAQLDDQATRAKAEFQGKHDAKTLLLIERVEAEAKKLREQTANQTAEQHQAAREARAEQINLLNAKLKQDIVDCQKQLQCKISELRTTEDVTNTLLDTGPHKETLTNEIINDLPEFDLPVQESKITDPVVPVVQPVIDEPIWDIESQVSDEIQKTRERPKTELSSQSDANVDLTSEESGIESTHQHISPALPAIENLNTTKPAIWGRGLPLFILSLLLFCVGTLAAAVSRIDLGSLMNFDLSEADFTWLGISCGIGLALAIIVGFVVRKLASLGVKQPVQEVLSDTSNAGAAIELESNISEPESFAPDAYSARLKASAQLKTSAEPSFLMPEVSQVERSVPKHELKKYDHRREAELQASADEQINGLVSQHAEQIHRHLAQFEDQFLQSKSESAEAAAKVENWRIKELSRIQEQSAASVEHAFIKLAQEVQKKHDQYSSEAATALSRWKANVLIASEVARISAARATPFPLEQFVSKAWTVPVSLPSTLTAGDLELTMPVSPETVDGELDSTFNIQLPGLLNFPRDASISIEHDANGREPALDFVRAIALRLLTSVAPGNIQFTLIDPVSPEQSFSGLTHLVNYNERIIDGQVWSDASQIEMSLQRVSDRIDRVLKAFLDSGANSLDEHNELSSDGKEPYHVVIVAGFPGNFTDEASRLLTSILNGGALCGVHGIVMWSSDQALPKSFKTKTFQKNCTQFQVINGAVRTGSSLTAIDPNETNELVHFAAIQSPNLEEYAAVVSAVGHKLQPVTLDKDAALEPMTLLEHTSRPEQPVESTNGVDSDNVTAVEVHEQSFSPEQPIAEHDSAFEAVVAEQVTSETLVFENSTFNPPVVESQMISHGIAEIPVIQDEGPNTIDFTITGRGIPVAEAAVEQAAALESSDTRHEANDPSLASELATSATAPAIENCSPLAEKLAQEFIEPNKKRIPVWIGLSSSNAPMSYQLMRARGQNMLIVGKNDDLVDEIFASTILSLCAGRASAHPLSPKVILVHDGMNQKSLRKMAMSFSDAVTPRFAIRSAAGIDAVVAELIEEMNVREKNRRATDAPEIVFAVRNIGQFPSLRRDYETAGNESSKSTSGVPRFGDLLRQGPRVGIHVMLWSDTFETALQCLSHSFLRECDTRIVLTMNSEDSASLINSPNAATIDSETAILYSEQTSVAQQFRPFAWPSTEWLATLPQSTVTVTNEATEASPSNTTETNSTEDQVEISDSDGFTLADDVAQTGTALQPIGESSPSDISRNSSEITGIANVPAPVSTKDPGVPKVHEKATSKSKRDTKAVQSKSPKSVDKPSTSVVANPAADTEIPTNAATFSPDVVASAEAPLKKNQSSPEKKVSGMAVRMSSRNSDPLKPLDAPPERQAQVVSNQPAPEAEFDEMDFNSLMIE